MEITDILEESYIQKGHIYAPQSLGAKTVWDTLATDDLLDAATSATSEEHAKEKGASQIAELKKELSSGVLLDLGCGYGRVAEQLLVERSFDGYIGLDSSPQMLTFAYNRKKERQQHDTPMYFVYGQIDAIPFDDAVVDNVIVSAVFLHNHKSVTARSVTEITRVLKPEGKLFVYGSFPNLVSLMGFQAALYLFLLNIFGDGYRNGPVRYYSRNEIKKLLTEFSDVSINSAGFAILPKRILIFPDSVNYFYVRYVANPVNSFLEKLLPASSGRFFSTHYDVIAIK